MIDPPKTLEEAQKRVYGTWAGNPRGHKYVKGNCAMEVWPTHGWIPYQCSRKNGHGPDGLYCKQHAKKVEVEK